MVDYANEEEQIQAIKAWWNEKGKNLLLMTITVFSILIAYQVWTSKKISYAEDASSLYIQLQEKVKKQQSFDSLAKQLKDEYPKSTYAQLAALFMAKNAVVSGDLEKAEKELAWAEDGKDTATSSLAELRLARVLFAQSKYNEVLSLVSKSNYKIYELQLKELKGDVLLKQNKIKEAKEIYTQISEAAKLQNKQLPVLDLKLQSIAI